MCDKFRPLGLFSICVVVLDPHGQALIRVDKDLASTDAVRLMAPHYVRCCQPAPSDRRTVEGRLFAVQWTRRDFEGIMERYESALAITLKHRVAVAKPSKITGVSHDESSGALDVGCSFICSELCR